MGEAAQAGELFLCLRQVSPKEGAALAVALCLCLSRVPIQAACLEGAPFPCSLVVVRLREELFFWQALGLEEAVGCSLPQKIAGLSWQQEWDLEAAAAFLLLRGEDGQGAALTLLRLWGVALVLFRERL